MPCLHQHRICLDRSASSAYSASRSYCNVAHVHALVHLLIGCDPDTFKLFVGNIPKSYTELQLLPLFETIGQVVDLVIVRDRNTHESKVRLQLAQLASCMGGGAEGLGLGVLGVSRSFEGENQFLHFKAIGAGEVPTGLANVANAS